MSPCFARVSRLIDSITHRQIGALQAFATGDVNNVGIGSWDRDRSDRLRRLAVEDRVPGASVVIRSPNAAIGCADIKDARLARNTGYRARPAAAEWPDHAPMHFLIEIFRVLLRARC